MNKRNRRLFSEAKKSVLILPSVILLLVFFVTPILLTVYYSFTNLALSGENSKQLKFIGLSNYISMFKDHTMWISIFNTLVFLLGSLVGQQVLGFFIALNMRKRNRIFRGIVGPIFLAGWILPEVVVALCCSTFFGDEGTLNKIFSFFNLPTVEFLFAFPLATVILANIWHGTAFSMMNFQSALDGVPMDIEEAARVDGAGPGQVIIRIILPCIKNTIDTNTMLNTLSTLGVFGLIYMMTKGGPGTKTLTLPIFMYRQAFVSQQLGYGTAISMILLVIGIVLSVFYTRVMRKD